MERAERLIKIPAFGNVEKYSLVVIGLLVVVNYLLGYSEMAMGVAAGGLLFVANFIAIRFIVNALVANSYPTGFGIFAFILKMVVFIGIIAGLFLFSKLNIYGFFIGVSAVVIVIIGEGLKGNKDGTF